MNWKTIYEKLVSFAKENVWVLMPFWFASAIILFAPAAWLHRIHLSDLPESIDIFVGLLFVLSSCLLFIRGLQVVYEKRCAWNKREQAKAVLLKLEYLLKDNCLSPDIFHDKDTCVRWANKVAPLLETHPGYYQGFIEHRDIIHRLSVEAVALNLTRMKEIVDATIEDLKANQNKST